MTLRTWKNAVDHPSKPPRTPEKVDETSINVKKTWMYLYRAVDSQRNTLDFVLSPIRDGEAAKRFCVKTLAASPTTGPRLINVDETAASLQFAATSARQDSLE
jgi:IS6 family transposase